MPRTAPKNGFRDYLIAVLLTGASLASVYALWTSYDLRPGAIAAVESSLPFQVRAPSQIDWRSVKEAKIHAGDFVQTPIDSSVRLIRRDLSTEELPTGATLRFSDDHGHLKMEKLITKDPVSGLALVDTSKMGTLGLEWAEIRLFPETPNFHHEEVHQRLLSGRMEDALHRRLSVEYTFHVAMPELHVTGAFDDYTIEPSYPPTGSIFRLANRESGCIGLVWTPVPTPHTSYIVEIAKTRDFAFFRSFGSDKNFLRLKANQSSDYFWRVRALHGRETFVGGSSRFTVYKPPPTPEELKRLKLVQRIRDINAHIADLEFCY